MGRMELTLWLMHSFHQTVNTTGWTLTVALKLSRGCARQETATGRCTSFLTLVTTVSMLASDI